MCDHYIKFSNIGWMRILMVVKSFSSLSAGLERLHEADEVQAVEGMQNIDAVHTLDSFGIMHIVHILHFSCNFNCLGINHTSLRGFI